MKLIIIDNFDREWITPTLVAENVQEIYGKIICKAFNEKYGCTEDYMELVDDDYILRT